jgi:phosphatidate cytidylyltransferase
MADNGSSSGGSRLTSLIPRLLTAIVYAGVMLGVIIFGGTLGLGIVISIAAMLAVSEFYSMTRREHRQPNEVFGIIATGAMPICTAVWGMQGLLTVVTALLVVSLIWHVAFRTVTTADTATTVFGALYVGFMLSFFVLIRDLDEGTLLALATLLSVWANDVFAYLVGSMLGKHKMSPNISPNKSWEGFAGGTIFTILVWVGLYFVIDSPMTLWWHALVGLAIALAGVLGDLAESRLKREAGVKDSGRLLPGHGGFLDRFDSLIMVSVVAYYLLIFGGVQ